MDDLSDATFHLERWRVEPALHRIRRGEDRRQLDPRTMDVLVCLARRAGEVVSRDDLVSAVWGESAYVAENTVSQAISRLRRALDDDWRQPRFIETVSKAGYRLMVPATAGGGDSDTETGDRRPADATASARRSSGAWLTLGTIAVVALVVLTGAAIRSRSSLFSDRNPPPDPRPAVTLIGDEQFADLSPDGSRVAFSWAGVEERREKDVYVQEIDAENLVHLVENPEDHELFPAFSPDGGALAFARARPGRCALYRRFLLGGPEESLGGCTDIRDLAWSPGGRWLAFTDKPDPESVRRVVLLDLESRETRQLTRPGEGGAGDRFPAFSPDGGQVAFRRDLGKDQHVYVVAVGGGEPRRLTSDPGVRYRGHDWTPDGRELVVASDRHGRMALWRLPLYGGAMRRISLSDHWVVYPSFARTRNRMIYERVADVTDVWSLDLSAGVRDLRDGTEAPEPALLAVSSTRSEIHPRAAPDGRRLAYVSNRTGYFELWTSDRRGGEAIRHTRFEGALVSSPWWSPDGRRLVFDADAEGGQKDLYVVESDSRAPRRLTRAESEERSPTYSLDGRSIYFASDRSGSWEIWKMPAAGGAAVQVSRYGGFRAVEGPGGRYLYYSKRRERGVWRRPLAGGEEVRLFDTSHPFDWATWEVGGEGIYFVARWQTFLCFYRFSDGEIVPILKPDREVSYATPALALADGGKTLLFAQVTRSEDETMLLDLGD